MDIKLSAQLRAKGEKSGLDQIPAVIYGKGVETQSLSVKRSDFEKVFRTAGESTLIDLDRGDGSIKVLVKDIQRDILKGFVTHIDFYQVNMKEKIKTEIPLHFVGEAKAVKELGGALIKDLDSVEVECLPGDLVDHIDVDISVLNTYEDAIRLNDLTLPKGLVLVSETNEMVAAVREPKAEAEPEPVAAATVSAGAAPAAGTAPAEGGKKEEKKEEKK